MAELLVALEAAQPLLILAHHNACKARDFESIKVHGDTLDAITRAIAKAKGESK